MISLLNWISLKLFEVKRKERLLDVSGEENPSVRCGLKYRQKPQTHRSFTSYDGGRVSACFTSNPMKQQKKSKIIKLQHLLKHIFTCNMQHRRSFSLYDFRCH